MNRGVSFALATVLTFAPWVASCSTMRPDKPMFPSIVGLQQVPMPGDVLEDLPKSNGVFVYGSGGFSDGYTAVVNGITFGVGVHALGKGKYRVDYVFTSDPAFVTPEGVKRGDTLASLLDHTASQLVDSGDFTAHLRLPSGWCAAFRNATVDAELKIVVVEITDASKVGYFFRW